MKKEISKKITKGNVIAAIFIIGFFTAIIIENPWNPDWESLLCMLLFFVSLVVAFLLVSLLSFVSELIWKGMKWLYSFAK